MPIYIKPEKELPDTHFWRLLALA